MLQSKAYLFGYCSLPLCLKKEERHDFIKNQISDNLFKQYKQGLESVGKLKNKKLFNPSYYYLWGKYDVCMISEIDDLEFPTRFFRSYNPIGVNTEKSDLQNFDYKVITGINPTVYKSRIEHRLPYISISELKINSAFLIGNGLNIVNGVVKKIKSTINKFKGDSIISFKICESYSYHELIVVLYGNSISSLKNIIVGIRELELNTLDTRLYNETIENSILNMLLSEEDKVVLDKNNLISNHIFESSLTTFGVNNLIYEKGVHEWNGFDLTQGEKISFISKLSVKPGHYHNVTNELKKSNNTHFDYTVVGKGDLMLINDITIDVEKNGFNSLYYPGSILDQTLDIHKHITETYTVIGFPNTNEVYPTFKHPHFDLHSNFKRLIVKPDIIKKVRTQMKNLRLPKVLSEKILKLISNYNNAILNPDMYASYIELYFYLKRNFVTTVDLYYNNVFAKIEKNQFTSRKLIDYLLTACNCLETSFQNRFYQSYWTSEVLEVNIDYSGGLHNLISAYDACVKVLNNSIMPRNTNSSFVFVKSDPTVYSTPDALVLNYLHLTQPYVFCAISFHEMVNFLFEKWYQNNIESNRDLTDQKRAQLINVLSLYYQADLRFRIDEVTEDIISEYKQKRKLVSPTGPIQEIRSKLKFSDYDLLPYLNALTFKYFITDYANFSYGYDKDFKLFCTTSWAYFIQLGNVYEKHDELTTSSFITTVIRLMLIRHYSGNHKQSVFPKEFDSFLSKDQLKYENEIYALINAITSNVDFNNWFESWVETFNSKEYNFLPRHNTSKDVTSVCHDVSKYLFNFDDVNIEPLTNKLNDYFYSSPKKETCLFPIYKYIIKNYLKFCSRDIGILFRSTGRNSQPDIIQSSSSKHLQIFIDQCGGTFVIGEENRKKYFSIRIKFIRLFWHLSFLQKKQYMNTILDN